MGKRLVVVVAMLGALALASSSLAAYSSPVLVQADIDVIHQGARPSWNIDYLLCYTGSGVVQAEVSEFQYLQGAKFRTQEVQTRGARRLQDPSERGAGGSCSWYRSRTYVSKFRERAGYVHGVTLQIFEAGQRSDLVTTRTFRLHP